MIDLYPDRLGRRFAQRRIAFEWLAILLDLPLFLIDRHDPVSIKVGIGANKIEYTNSSIPLKIQ